MARYLNDKAYLGIPRGEVVKITRKYLRRRPRDFNEDDLRLFMEKGEFDFACGYGVFYIYLTKYSGIEIEMDWQVISRARYFKWVDGNVKYIRDLTKDEVERVKELFGREKSFNLPKGFGEMIYGDY